MDRVEKLFYSLSETAEMLGIRPATATRWIAEEKFPVPVVKVGTRFYVRSRHFDEFVRGDDEPPVPGAKGYGAW